MSPHTKTDTAPKVHIPLTRRKRGQGPHPHRSTSHHTQRPRTRPATHRIHRTHRPQHATQMHDRSSTRYCTDQWLFGKPASAARKRRHFKTSVPCHRSDTPPHPLAPDAAASTASQEVITSSAPAKRTAMTPSSPSLAHQLRPRSSRLSHTARPAPCRHETPARAAVPMSTLR
jgi:hypothetical protein